MEDMDIVINQSEFRGESVGGAGKAGRDLGSLAATRDSGEANTEELHLLTSQNGCWANQEIEPMGVCDFCGLAGGSALSKSNIYPHRSTPPPPPPPRCLYFIMAS